MRKIDYTHLAQEHLGELKTHIARDNPEAAKRYLRHIKQKIELLAQFPYLGRVNSTFGIESIRDLVVLGHKIIYKIDSDAIIVLALYRYADFDEERLHEFL